MCERVGFLGMLPISVIRICLLALVGLIVACSSCGHGPPQFVRDQYGERPPESALDRHVQGLAAAESGPERAELPSFRLRTVTLHGSPLERGRQHGTTLRHEIETLTAKFVQPLVAERGDRLRSVWNLLAPNIPQEYLDEMIGISEGSGVPLEIIQLTNILVDALKIAACTVVVRRDPVSHDLYFGRNLDFRSMGIAEKYSVIFEIIPEHGNRMISIGWPGLVGVLTGMNEHGLTLAMLEVYGSPAKLTRPPLPYAIAYRQVLSEAFDAPTARSVLRRYPIATQNNLVVVDALGAGFIASIDVSGFSETPIDSSVAFAINDFKGSQGESNDSRSEKVGQYANGNLGTGSGEIEALKAVLRRTALPGLNMQSMILYPRRKAASIAAGVIPAVQSEYFDYIFKFGR